MKFGHALGMLVLAAAVLAVSACDRSGSESGSGSGNGTTPTGAAESRSSTGGGEAAQNNSAPASLETAATMNASGENTAGIGGAATTQPSTSSSSNMPGLPSVNGTSVKGLSTADAAATRLIDEAKNAIGRGDVSKAKTLVEELKQKGMYDSLSAPVKSQVNELAMQVGKAGSASQPQ